MKRIVQSADSKDPHDLEKRQLAHCSEMMEWLELIDIGHNAKLPFKERITCMLMIHTIRKEANKGKADDSAGAKVRKYTKSFEDASAGRSEYTGSDDADDDDADEAPARGANGSTDQPGSS